MVRHARWIMVPALLGLLAALPALAQNRTDYIQDEAALFSKEAKVKANGEIARIYAQHRREFVVDTVFSVKLPQDVDANNSAAVKRAVDDWANKRAGREKVNGIELIIVGEPPTVRVELGNRTMQSGLFTDADRDELRNQVITNLKLYRKDPKNQQAKDHVLLAATAFVGQRMNEHHRQTSGQGAQVPVAQTPVPQRQAHETPWLMYILIIIGILFAFWIIRGIFRGLSGAMGGGGQRMAGGGYGGGGPGYGGGGYGGGGYGGCGGGFMSGMLGGLFGAVAGNWMYNNMFGGHSSSAWGAGPTAGAGGAGPTAGNDADTSYSGTGGDYGDTGADAGAGADAGNPDAGTGGDGGDWGGGGGGDTGGDAGGGGGDWGGGGGGDFGGGGGGDFGGGGGGGGDW
jgi:hypothetical protein